MIPSHHSKPADASRVGNGVEQFSNGAELVMTVLAVDRKRRDWSMPSRHQLLKGMRVWERRNKNKMY